MDSDSRLLQFSAIIQEMTAGIVSTREIIRSIRDNRMSLDFSNGISLFSTKHHLFLLYLNSLALVSSRRAVGHSLSVRSQPDEKFSTPERSSRGNGSGDLVDFMVEGRLVLEKIQVLEGRMRYQIEKLVKAAQAPERSLDAIDDPLAFRPNPDNLVDDNARFNTTETFQDDHARHLNHNAPDTVPDGIYRPPRVAPVPYNDKSQLRSRKDRTPLPSALSSLPADPSRPHTETTSGLGSTPSLTSNRAAYLKRLTEFEEENFSRIVMKKSEARRRARDEEDLALGGRLQVDGGRNRRRAGGLEDEFADVLRSVDRTSHRQSVSGQGDGYDELRRLSKKGDVLQRSRLLGNRKRAPPEEDRPAERAMKRSRFELAAKKIKKGLERGK